MTLSCVGLVEVGLGIDCFNVLISSIILDNPSIVNCPIVLMSFFILSE